MSESISGHAPRFTGEQEPTAQCQRPAELCVAAERIYIDHGLTGTTHARSGLDQALATAPPGETVLVRTLDRLARSLRDAHAIGNALTERGIERSIGGRVSNPADPMGSMFSNILATFAECEVDLPRLRTREGMAVADAKGKLCGKRSAQAADRTAPDARSRREQHQRFRRAVLHRQGHRPPTPAAQ